MDTTVLAAISAADTTLSLVGVVIMKRIFKPDNGHLNAREKRFLATLFYSGLILMLIDLALGQLGFLGCAGIFASIIAVAVYIIGRATPGAPW
jgi:uncharacterized membrane protein